MSAISALWFAAGLTACSTDRLPPVAPPPPPVVQVPVAVRIPIAMTEPCARPERRPLRTDVELLEAADAFKVWGECNAAKLRAIEAAQPGGGAAP
jgi:hypothetical protein